MTVHSPEIDGDRDGNAVVSCTGCPWYQFTVVDDLNAAHAEFAAHLAERFHPQAKT